MKKHIIKLSLASLVAILFSFTLPEGWIIAGSKPKSYDMGIAPNEGRDGKNCATIQSKDKKIEGFGTLMQMISAEKYKGKRLKLSAYIKTQDVEKWCGLWMRGDGLNKELLAFDNMGNRPIKGNTEWKIYEVILDIPESTHKIAFGTLLDGTGKVWIDDYNMEIVEKTVPTTGNYSNNPKNLSFDE